jgi:hypothetical protein
MSSTSGYKETLESHSALLVECVPVGAISPQRFDRFMALLQRFSTMRLEDLTRPGGYSFEKNPFDTFSWNNGAIFFNFRPSSGGGAGKFAGLMAFEGLMAHRATLAVIGICHCPSTPDLARACVEFDQEVAERYPHAVHSRCFAFDHTFEDGSPPGLGSARSLEMFPPEQRKIHMEFVLNSFAVTLITCIEKEIHGLLAARGKSKGLLLQTPLDQDDDGGGGGGGGNAFSGSSTRRRKRQQARAYKRIGDLCLFACCPSDAVKHYEAAVEQCRAANDHVWAAAADEGIAASLVANERIKTLVGEAAHWVPDVVSFCLEAAKELSKHPGGDGAQLATLELESTLKLTRYLAQKRARWGQALTLLSGLTAKLPHVVDAHHHVQLLLEAALLCEDMRYRRKFAHFMLAAASMYGHLGRQAESYCLTMLAAHEYGLVAGEAHAGAGGVGGSAGDLAIAGGAGAAAVADEEGAAARQVPASEWLSLSIHVLRRLVKLAKELGDSVMQATHTMALLRTLVADGHLKHREKRVREWSEQWLQLQQQQQLLRLQQLRKQPLASSGQYGVAGVAGLRDFRETFAHRFFELSGGVSATARRIGAAAREVKARPKRGDGEGGLGGHGAGAGDGGGAGGGSAGGGAGDAPGAPPPKSPLRLRRSSGHEHSVGTIGSADSRAWQQQQNAAVAEQVALLSTLGDVTATLPPSFQINMTGFPWLVRLWPRVLPDALAPVKTDEVAMGDNRISYTSGGNFFFNPLGEKKAKDVIVHWVANEVAEVTIVLCNPTALPLHITRAQLSTTGPPTECYDAECTLEPHEVGRELKLAAKPLRQGELAITGVKLTCMNLVWEHAVDALGEALHPCPFPLFTSRGVPAHLCAPQKQRTARIAVLPALPVLSLKDWLPDSVLMPRYQGEGCLLDLYLENVGTMPIGQVAITAAVSGRAGGCDGGGAGAGGSGTGSGDKASAARSLVFSSATKEQGRAGTGQSDSTLSWDEDALADLRAALPLAPQQCYRVPLRMRADAECVDIAISYSGCEGAEFSRSLEVPCRMQLARSLELVSAEVICASALPAGLRHQPVGLRDGGGPDDCAATSDANLETGERRLRCRVAPQRWRSAACVAA